MFKMPVEFISFIHLGIITGLGIVTELEAISMDDHGMGVMNYNEVKCLKTDYMR